ncbi:helix-turn-helix domain-containing protein [Reyranella sp. CPCC 100927]|nr:helix-turn-helix domain-containing protein [Reyranella sp. CPCC 100927]
MSDPLIDPARAQSDSQPPLIAAWREEAAPRLTAVHRHARAQLIGAVRGLLSISTEHGWWVIPPNHALWVPSNHFHGVRSHGPFAGWSIYVASTACVLLPPQPRLVKSSALLRAAVNRAASWPDGPLTTSQVRLLEVMFDEISALPPSPLGLALPRDPRLLRIAQALADDPANGRSLASWAAWAAVSPRTLSRRFPLETGLSFTRWRQHVRLLRALEMLVAGQSVTAIAIDLGYDNVSAFIAMFRRTFGVTPTRYVAPDDP